ncbi:MAG: outer membrane lipoprotein-sorting protein [Candidatus Eisenbacteria sp.]|nr:outer membrane lipoprotein-sorting protein [Candidatus Eisenbacteria bacterium]
MNRLNGKRRTRAPDVTLGVAVVLALALSAVGAAAREGTDRQVATAIRPTTDTEAPDVDAPDVDRLLRRYDDLYDSTGTIARVEISIVTAKKTRTLRLRLWGKGEDKALIVIDAPPRDAGTATLKVDKNLWNYLPKISRTIRVPPSMMMGSWMGSDLTNDDLVRDSSYEDDYESEVVGRSEDPPGWKVRMNARPDAVGLWNSVEMVFAYDDWLPVMAQFFDRKDRLSRTMRFEDVKVLGGRRIPTLISIVPEREEGRRTEFRYLDVEFDVALSDDMFSLSRLERTH